MENTLEKPKEERLPYALSLISRMVARAFNNATLLKLIDELSLCKHTREHSWEIVNKVEEAILYHTDTYLVLFEDVPYTTEAAKVVLDMLSAYSKRRSYTHKFERVYDILKNLIMSLLEKREYAAVVSLISELTDEYDRNVAYYDDADRTTPYCAWYADWKYHLPYGPDDFARLREDILRERRSIKDQRPCLSIAALDLAEALNYTGTSDPELFHKAIVSLTLRWLDKFHAFLFIASTEAS
jgi:hypothetical protein